MTINSYKPINGTLSIGAGPLVVSSQVTACELVPSEKVKETDPIPVLSGEELAGDSSSDVSFRLKFSIFQDLLAAGIVAYSYAHSGEEVAFTFEPTDEDGQDASIAGTVVVVPIKIGGKVSKTERATADCDWRVVGTPVPTWGAVGP